MPDLHDHFGRLDDDAWRRILLRSIDNEIVDGVRMPGFPPEAEQQQFVGCSREAAVEQAFAFFRVVKAACGRLGRPLGPETKLLDLGVGWGRIARTFMKDVPAANIVGLDVNRHILERCRTLMPYGSWRLCRHGEPWPVGPAEFCLVTAYSVFSHLSQTAQMAAVEEIARALRPGGLAVVTVLSRQVLAQWRAAATDPASIPFGLGSDDAGWRRLLLEHDDGEMLFLPTGGGLQGLDSVHYGWATVPRGYAERAWAPWFEVIDLIADEAVQQDCYVLRRRVEASSEPVPAKSLPPPNRRAACATWLLPAARAANAVLARADIRIGLRSTYTAICEQAERLDAQVVHLREELRSLRESHPRLAHDPAPAVHAVSPALSRREKLLGRIDVAKGAGLEIGPLDKPTILPEHGNIRYVDFATAAELKARHAHTPTVDTGRIGPVHYVWGQQTLCEAVGDDRFDYVVASHVVEHVPDLIGWFSEVATVLRPGGVLSLIVPDKRYIFDRLRPETQVAEVVDAYLNRNRRPSVRQVFEAHALHARVDGSAVWNGAVDDSAIELVHTPAEAYAISRHAADTGQYTDVHCWVFTPLSFLGILRTLIDLALFDFRLLEFHPTTQGEIDFFVTLEALPPTLLGAERSRLQRESLP